MNFFDEARLVNMCCGLRFTVIVLICCFCVSGMNDFGHSDGFESLLGLVLVIDYVTVVFRFGFA